MKNVLHINRYNALGIFFLLPFASMFVLDLVTRIIQGNMLSPNVHVLNGIYNSPLYWAPILFMWVILFPILAAVINLVSLIKNARINKNHILNKTFLTVNLITLTIVFLGLSVVAFIKLHDFIPCLVNSLFSQGISHFGQIFSVCKNA